MTTVDPALEARIGSAGAPTATPPRAAPPKEMPGEDGIVNGIRYLIGFLRHGIDFLASKREQYGDIYRAQFAGDLLVTVWDADLVHQIMQNNDKTWSTALGWNATMFNRVEPGRGNVGALLALDFEDHRTARKWVQPAFTMKAIDGYLEIASRRFDTVFPRWLAAKRVDFKAEARKLLADVATEIFTGLTDPHESALVDHALGDFWRGGLALFRNAWLSPTHRRSRKGLQTLLQRFLALAPERRKNPGPDLFSRMCQGTDEDGRGDDAMVRVFVTILFGAFDTTSAALTSMAYLLAKHPEWQERLREEARAIPEDALDASSMKALRQTEWAWKETLRLMPVTAHVPRVALRDVDLGGYAIKAGTVVMPMPAGLGHHPRWWKNPTVFDPERFSPERAEDKQHPAAFQPFGGGAHACVGMQLANMEVKLFWHKLLTRCSFTLENDYEGRHENAPLGTVSGNVALELVTLTAR